MNATKVKAIISLIIWLVVGAIAVNAFLLISQGGSWLSFTDPDADKTHPGALRPLHHG
jgi:hypothetical protein